MLVVVWTLVDHLFGEPYLCSLMAAIFNIQFVWFVIIGYIVFVDVPSDMVWLGAAILIGATTAVAMYEYRAARV